MRRRDRLSACGTDGITLSFDIVVTVGLVLVTRTKATDFTVEKNSDMCYH